MIIPEVAKKGKFELSTQTYIITVDGVTYRFIPNYRDDDGNIVPVVYRAVGLEAYRVKIKARKQTGKKGARNKKE
jgi:hypothetical protein